MSTLTLSSTDIAALGVAFALTSGRSQGHRIKDDSARAMVRATLAEHKSAASSAFKRAREAAGDEYRHSKACDDAIADLTGHYWPRATAVRRAHQRINAYVKSLHSAMRSSFVNVTPENLPDTATATVWEAFATVPRGVTLMAHYADAVIRADRLAVLSRRINEATAASTAGQFPLTVQMMDAETSMLLRSMAKKRYVFRGGRDAISDEYEHADILHDAFVMALEAGDCTSDGVPFLGPMFRYVHAARARRTSERVAEWSGIKLALIGAKPIERAYPDHDDKHTLRLLGTRNYGTRDTHAAAMAEAERAAEKRATESVVWAEARTDALDKSTIAYGESFAGAVARLILAGHTITAIAEALGLAVGTVLTNVHADTTDRVIAGGQSRLRPSGLDHEWNDDTAEHERDIMHAQNEHARRQRERYELARRADYIRNRVAAA